MPNIEHTLWQALASAISGRETRLHQFEDTEILEQATRHGIGLLLDDRLRAGAGTVTGVGKTTMKQLSPGVHQNTALEMILNASNQKLLDMLAAKGIAVLLLKGTPFAHLYYPNTYLRPRCDTDIYIRESDIEAAADLLSNNNYKLSGLEKRKISSKQFLAAAPPIQKVYWNFDIHWKLSNRVMFRPTLPFDECWETRQPVPELGPNAHALSMTHLMIHACIHRIAHGRNTDRNRLIWLYDIHLLAEMMSGVELENFRVVARQKEVATLCADALQVCEEIFDTRLPKGYIEQLKNNCKNEPSAKLIEASKLRWAWADLQSLKGIPKKIAFARELLLSRKG